MLTDFEVAKTKPDPKKEIRLADGEGLHAVILPNGRRFWRWDYTYNGRRKQLSFGKYPAVKVKQAREKKTAAQEQLAAGTDPSAARKREKVASVADTFRAVADDWLEIQREKLQPSTWIAKRSRLQTFLLPALGPLTVRKIAPRDILPLLKAIERQGKRDTAHRVRQMASEIFCHAVAMDCGDVDPAALLGDALKPNKATNHPSLIEPVAVGQLLNAIDQAIDHATPFIAAALRLAPLFFVRPSELRRARWAEFNFDLAIWRIPAHRMKSTAVRIDHLVPLSTQAVAILRDLKTLAGDNPLVFPGVKSAARPISDSTLPSVLRRLGYANDVQSVHGFRTLASTHLREIGFENDLVELQLSHKIANPVRAAYDKAARVPERIQMMQAWADHLDAVKAGRVVAFTGRVLEFAAPAAPPQAAAS
jgi:integrase